AVTLTGTGDHRVENAVLQGAVVALPLLVGLWIRHHRRDDRFAGLLVAAGFGLAVVSLSGAGASGVMTVGRIALWVVDLGVVYIVLALPSGRLTGELDRWLVIASALLVGVLYLPTLPFSPRFPEPTPWSSCDGGCPSNALSLVDAAPGVVRDVVIPLRLVLTFVLLVAFALVLIGRVRAAKPLLRRTIAPTLAAALTFVVAHAIYLPLRAYAPHSAVTDAVGIIYLLSLPGLAVGFAGGFFARRVYEARVLERLAVDVGARVDAGELGRTMARSLEDPGLHLVYWNAGDPGGWVDETGWPVRAPQAEPGVAVTEVTAAGRPVAAILHDPVLAEDRAIVRAAAAHALVALENKRLISLLRASVRDLARSRSRVVTIADRERRRIERDLHDGAQQGLVSLRIRLAMLQERLEVAAPAEAAAVDELGHQVEEAIDQVRALAKGIYPPVLSERGIVDALEMAARTAALPVRLELEGIGRYRSELESTVYFACVEALQNASKHAGATEVTIALHDDGELHFEVRDDGAGFDGRLVDGSGLSNLRDRLAAVGGELRITSRPGNGTVVSGRVPIDDEPTLPQEVA
ncbi:MAG: hypothetical protein QOE86_1262, partial [Solirubrobacteraceae bacterium]|nr:hypothetical protein [Solirubrobacteraceae bacterium]